MTQYDLRYVQAALPELKNYLFSSELFWAAPASAARGQPAYAGLTLGNLLLHLAQAKALAGREAAAAEKEVDALRKQWRTHWDDKLRREFSSRLKQWLGYLNDLADRPRDHAAAYPSQVRLRVLLALMADALGSALPEDASLLTAADARLKARLAPGDFLWESGLQKAYPKGKYWFLYGKIKA
jgi:hypothetical protein